MQDMSLKIESTLREVIVKEEDIRDLHLKI
jgi:hypothetical protein